MMALAWARQASTPTSNLSVDDSVLVGKVRGLGVACADVLRWLGSPFVMMGPQPFMIDDDNDDDDGGHMPTSKREQGEVRDSKVGF
jgi:hypothetical protein